MMATIAVIAEKKISSAIIWKPLSSDRSDNDRQRLLSLRTLVSLWKALKASDIVWSVSISAVNHIIKEATCDPGIRISRFQGDWSFTRYMWGVQAVWESLNDFQTYLPISS